MKINLETDEVLEIIVDGICEFQVKGYRKEEGTMVLEVNSPTEQKVEAHTKVSVDAYDKGVEVGKAISKEEQQAVTEGKK